MRTRVSTFNALSNAILLISTTILSFISRTIFIKILGQECLGLDGLFINILSMLSLAELGIGTAINFSLYKPLAEKDTNKINILMAFYKKAYRNIGIIVLILGLVMVPFLKYFVKDYTVNNLEIIYILYLLNTVLSYFITYKNILLTADQKDYKMGTIKIFFVTIVYGAQIIGLLITKNYIIYLILLLIFKQIERFFINAYISKYYKEINFNSKEKMSKKEIKIIIVNIKGMMFHKIGNYFLNSTDNILISALIGIKVVGIYSNYLSVINVAKNLLVTTLSGATASFGNLLVVSESEKKEKVFKRMNFICFIVTGIIVVVLFNLFNPIILIWLGSNYLLDIKIVSLIVMNFYLFSMLIPTDIVKSAAGLYDVDKYIPILQAFINLFVSIILSKIFGLSGILLGTLISYIFIISWTKPYYVYKHVFKKSPKEYYKDEVKRILLVILNCFATFFIINFINLKVSLFSIIIYIVICSLVFLCTIFVIYYKYEEFFYIRKKLKNLLKRC